MSKGAKTFLVILGLAVVVFAAIFFGMNALNNAGKTDTQITTEETVN